MEGAGMPGEPQKKPEEKEPTFAEERMSNADLASRIRDLENTLAQTRAGIPINLIPNNGAGKGDNVAPTWSLAEQEEANRG